MKPAYHVPTLKEIGQLKPNGFKVISTFSGGGGSTLGYRMAGFKVVWASEFIEAAREVYRLNNPDTPVDPRDIREVAPEDILEATGLGVGELDLLDGSPPCSSFSLAGKRQKGWGQAKAYSDGAKQVTDDLFFEFARLLKGLQPKTFVAENVAGLVRGAAQGYFKLIFSALEDCGYRVRAALLNAQWLGVPQARERLIFVGVRSDLGPEPVHPTPLPYRYTLRDALPEGHLEGLAWVLPEGSQTLRLWRWAKDHGLYSLRDAALRVLGKETMMQHYRQSWDRPCNTVVQGSICCYHPEQPRSLSIPELKRVCGFPDDYRLEGTFSRQWERLGRAVPPVMMGHIAAAVRDGVLKRLVEAA